MVHCNVILHNDNAVTARRFFPLDHGPNVLQIATSTPQQIEDALLQLDSWDPMESTFEEINLNCGCPAESASNGAHGAFLLRDGERDNLYRLCESLKKGAKSKQTSVKIRTGLSGNSSYEKLRQLVGGVVNVGIDHVILHARDAIIGESCRNNRRIPPLRPEWARALRADFPEVRLTFNGEVKSVYQAKTILDKDGFDGVMMGRQAINEPFSFILADEVIFGEAKKDVSREDIVDKYIEWLEKGENLAPSNVAMVAPLINLFHGCPASKLWKRVLLERKIDNIVERINDAKAVIKSMAN
jgi:tRNA-dihydrouridine synthase A